ncbi:unnamed protein product [Penicillium glandicola]
MPLNAPFGSLDGATALTQFAITQTENLAEEIEEYELYNIPLPEHLSAGIGSLSTQLQSFRPDDDIQLFLRPGMDAQEIIYNNLEMAWYLSTLVYFHNRINELFLEDVYAVADAILMCLLRAEEFKAEVELELMYRDEPVTFPAFVASCNAIDRESWAYWWRWIQEYDLPNIKAQWEVIQVIWEIMDETQEVGEADLSWVEIMQGPEIFRLSTMLLYLSTNNGALIENNASPRIDSSQ